MQFTNIQKKCQSSSFLSPYSFCPPVAPLPGSLVHGPNQAITAHHSRSHSTLLHRQKEKSHTSAVRDFFLLSNQDSNLD